MAWYPQNATGLNYGTYPSGTSSATVTASGSTNTKGSYTQMVASSSFLCNSVVVNVQATNISASQRYLFDVSTGAGGAEVDVVPNMLIGGRGATSGDGKLLAVYMWLPLAIANATRIAMRCQSTTASQAIFPIIQTSAAGGVAGVSPFTNYGASTGSSTGVTLDPGGVANTYGSYAAITASSSAVIQWLMLLGAGDTTGTGATTWYVEISTGAGGAEVVLIPDIHIGSGGGNSVVGQFGWNTYIAASTRIACRAASDSTSSGNRQIAVELLATVAPSEPSGSSGGAWAYA